MYDISTDRGTNRLYLDLTGRMEAEEIEEAAEETITQAEQLDTGFDIVNDLRGFRPPTPEAAKSIKRAQKELVELGVDRVLRVVDDETSDVVVNAFERRSRDAGYSGETVNTMEEAERLLDEKDIEGYR